MKTFIYFTNRNKIRNTIACFAVAAALFTGQVASAQTVRVTESEPVQSQITGSFKAAIYPVQHSLFVKVHVENPAREIMTVTIKNADNEIVYKKMVGKEAKFLGKFDVSRMPDGAYTMTVQSLHHQYTNTFTIQTQRERAALALN